MIKKSDAGLIVLFFFSLVGLSWGAVIGDVDGNGSVGLPEAIHALQVAADIRTQSVEPAIDFRKYFYVAEGDYVYTNTSWPTPTSGSSVSYHLGIETVNGVSMLVRTTTSSSSISKQYYIVNSSGVTNSGSSWVTAGVTTTVQNNPAVIIGKPDMIKGDIIPNFYLQTASAISTPYYEETTFLGKEDVVVAAGTFTNSLKLLRKSYPISSMTVSSPTFYLDYYAENIGRVKSISTSGSIMELQYAKIGGSAYPQNSVRYTGTYVITVDSVANSSGTFNFVSSIANGKSGGALIYNYGSSSAMSYTLTSSDGVHFTADPAVYGDNPPAINLVVSQSPCTISGTIVSTNIATHHGTTGEPTTPPVIIMTVNGSCS